jgi:O-acetyl-ADP-ribose deacetylase (regulator of RNase III)
MIKEIKANLLDFPEGINVLCHVCNCCNTMGSGIASQIKLRYPQAYLADTEYNKKYSKENMLGSFSGAVLEDGKKILNLYAQYNYGRESRQLNYESFYLCLERLKSSIQKSDKKYIVGFPYKIGSDRAGGDWNVVLAMIHSVFDNSGIDVIICRYE